MVHDAGAEGPFAALPHAIIRKTSLSRDARLLVATIQMYGWNGGECRASHATLAADMGCSTRMLRVYLTELVRAGIITEHDAGARRQKTYRLASIGTVLPIEAVNEKPASDSGAVNEKFSTVQSESIDTSNRKPVSDSKKKTTGKKKLEEELPPTEVGAAGAASPPVKVKQPKKSSRPGRLGDETPCPDTIPLTEQSYETAAKWGFDRAAVDFELEHFLESARANGRVYVDWKAAFRTWLLKAVQFAKEDKRPVGSRPQRNGTAPNPAAPPAGRASMSSKWAGFDGRHGSNLSKAGPSDGR